MADEKRIRATWDIDKGFCYWIREDGQVESTKVHRHGPGVYWFNLPESLVGKATPFEVKLFPWPETRGDR